MLPAAKDASWRDSLAQVVNADRGLEAGRTSFEVLAHIDPARVKAACPHADALLERLKALSDPE